MPYLILIKILLKVIKQNTPNIHIKQNILRNFSLEDYQIKSYQNMR